MAFQNPDDEQIRALLKAVKNIAVIGFSPRLSRPSHAIARQLQRMGFRIIPVRPGITEGLGEKAYPDLRSVADAVHLADVFRNGRYVPAIVEQCLERGVKNLWMQEGCINEAAAERARAAGMTVIMDRCIARDYLRLCS